jgi:eukaryotic-like serine/threonine-protein kinase
MILERGTLLNNRYKIVEILGQGGMGSVYRAIDENLGVEVAVKDNLFTTEEYARQFRREAVILANLRHANLPRVTDHFVINSQGQYLVMDYIEGEDLRQRMERVGTLPEEEVILIGAAVCDALSYLGSRKPAVIHRDLKPGNVKITPQGQIFLVDFGLAKTMQGSQATTTGARAMTPGFSPPEQYGTARTDQRSDIFSLGATLYAALTGYTPEDALARAMDQSELTPVRKYNPRVSRRLASVIEKALEIRPDDRYQTAEEFKQSLLSASPSARRREGEFVVTPPPEESRQIPPEDGLSYTEAGLPDNLNNRLGQLLPVSGAVEDEPKPAATSREKKRGIGCWLVVMLVVLAVVGVGAWIYRIDPGLPDRLGGQFLPVVYRWLPTMTPTSPPLTVVSETPTEMAVITATKLKTPEITKTLVPSPSPSPILPSPTVMPTPSPTALPTPFGGGASQIAFASSLSGENQIYLINADGTDRRKITDLREGACQPNWSPDGQRLVFVSPCSNKTDYYPGSALFIINADGSGLLPLPTVSGGDYSPSWSPDGKQIAFTSLRNSGRVQIYLLNLEDNSVTPLSEKYSVDSQPSWSKDGKQIIFVSERRAGQQVWVMDANGQNQRQFTRNPDLFNFLPSWSPDMQSVIFTQYVALGGIPRVLISPYSFANYTEYRVGQGNMPMRDAVFSPDGFWLAFEGWEVGGSHNIYVITATGAGLARVTNDPELDFDPAWRPMP